jgi:hypothetical protein
LPYTAEISRSNPTAFLFLIDQSGSMIDPIAKGKTKADQVADVLNRTIANIIIRCTKSEGVRDYFHLGVIAYGGYGVTNGFQGNLQHELIHPISDIEPAYLRIEERLKKIDDGAGGIVEQTIKFPVWFDPEASGGTPMRAALAKAAEVVGEWCDSHRDSYPPTILHITDGASTDGDPEELAKDILKLDTDDGTVLMFNLHVSSSISEPTKFPSSEITLQDEYSRMLFRMSSVLPEHLIRYAQEKGINVANEAKGFIFNADSVEIVDFFDIGTRASQLR